jgi:hypothetical protein
MMINFLNVNILFLCYYFFQLTCGITLAFNLDGVQMCGVMQLYIKKNG